MLIRLVCGK